MAFHARLKELREAAGLTQVDLAERSGVPKPSIANLEQGRRKPALETAQKLATALGVSCEAFNEPAESDEPAPRGRPRKASTDAPAGEPPASDAAKAPNRPTKAKKKGKGA